MPEIDLNFRPVSYWPESEPLEDGIDIATISVDSHLGDEFYVIAELPKTIASGIQPARTTRRTRFSRRPQTAR